MSIRVSPRFLLLWTTSATLAAALLTLLQAGTSAQASTRFLPQVADGPGIRVEVIIQNVSDGALEATLSFRKGEGEAMSLTLEGESASVFQVTVPPRGVRRLASAGGESLQAGYAVVTGDLDAQLWNASVIYQSGGAEVSVNASRSAPGHSGFVQLQKLSGQEGASLSSGMALVNPEPVPQAVRLRLLGQDGQVEAVEEMLLAAAEHRALLIDEVEAFRLWFEEDPERRQSFQGSLEATSQDGAFAMTLLRVQLPGGRLANLGTTPLDTLFAFVGVNVVPMDSEIILAEQTVLVRGDRIERIGPVSLVEVPEGAVIIEGAGRYLMPGLADMHVHMGFTSDTLLFLANGVTTVREMWGSPGHVRLRDLIRQGDFLGPDMLVTGPGFDGNPPVWPRTLVLDDPSQADQMVADYQAQGYDFLKIYNRITAQAYPALTAAAQARGLRTIGHVPFAVGLDEVIAGGQESIEHWVTLTPQGVGAWHLAISDGALQQLAGRLTTAGLWSCPTLYTNEVMFTQAEKLAFLEGSPFLRFVHPLRVEDWRTSPTFNTPALRQPILANKQRMTRTVQESGGLLLTGTDAGFIAVIPGFTIHDELRLFVQSGLTPYQALRASTFNAASFARQLDEWGTVMEGRRADLLLLEANPLQDVANVAQKAGVMVRGRWLTEDELQRRLEELAASFIESSSAAGRSQAIAGDFRVPGHSH